MSWPTAHTESCCVSHPTPTRRCTYVGPSKQVLMHFCTALVSSNWCPLWACAATKGGSLSCKVCVSTWSGVVGLCSFILYFFLQQQRMGSTGKVRCSSGGRMQQWRNVTLCRTPADCNLPPLSGAQWRNNRPR